MDTMKKFVKYAIWLILGYIIVNLFTYGFIVKSYSNIDTYKILIESPSVSIAESKATKINGYIIGNVKNNTDSMINGKYLRINFYDKIGQYVGTNYVELDNFQSGKTFEFRSNFNYMNVNSYTIDVTDTVVEGPDTRPWFMHPDSDFARVMSWVGIVMIIWYVF